MPPHTHQTKKFWTRRTIAQHQNTLLTSSVQSVQTDKKIKGKQCAMKISMTTRACYVHISNNTVFSPWSSKQGLSYLNLPIHIFTGTQTHQRKKIIIIRGEEGERPSTAHTALYLHDSSCEATPIFLALTRKNVHWKQYTSNSGAVQMLKENHCVALRQCEYTFSMLTFLLRLRNMLDVPQVCQLFLLEG